MSGSQRHVIRRECIDLAFDGTESDGLALQGRVVALCRDWLAPALDEAFGRAVPDGEHWRFERIEVDAGRFTPETFERDFVAAVTAAVGHQIQAHQQGVAIASASGASGEGTGRASDAQALQEALLFFLTTGALPWSCHLPEGRTLEQALRAAWRGEAPSRALLAALPPLLASPMTRLRMARQFTAAFLDVVLEHLAPGAPALLRAHLQQSGWPDPLEETPQDVQERAWLAAFACVALRQPFTGQALRQAWEAAAPARAGEASAATGGEGGKARASSRTGAAAPGERSQAAGQEASPGTARAGRASPAPDAAWEPLAPSAASAPQLDLYEGVFVDGAGVVLLHPFLPTLFERLRISADGVLVQPDRALALLHFLVTGQASAPEYALVLPKLLCGLEPSVPAGAPVVLSADEQAEAQALLQAAITHWQALGDSSPDALRGTFLARPGKLSKRGEDDLLQVERQAFDVLLGRLPWSMDPVFLPWMKRLLWVEWPY